MLDYKYIIDAHIDKKSDTIILSDAIYDDLDDDSNADKSEIKCKACGATNKASSRRCEYCGTELHGDE